MADGLDRLLAWARGDAPRGLDPLDRLWIAEDPRCLEHLDRLLKPAPGERRRARPLDLPPRRLPPA